MNLRKGMIFSSSCILQLIAKSCRASTKERTGVESAAESPIEPGISDYDSTLRSCFEATVVNTRALLDYYLAFHLLPNHCSVRRV